MDRTEMIAALWGRECLERIPRVREALERRGTCGLGEISDVGPIALRITLPAPDQGVAQISVSAAPDVRGDLYAEIALIDPNNEVMAAAALGYEDGIGRFWTEDEFFAELERLSSLLVN